MSYRSIEKKRACNRKWSRKRYGFKPRLRYPDDFLKRVLKTDRCWLWLKKNGQVWTARYGRLMIAYKPVEAHRYAYELFIGPVPEGLMVLHSCDNPPCVNPDHLFLGTARDNILDMISKNRHPWQLRPRSKLGITND